MRNFVKTSTIVMAVFLLVSNLLFAQSSIGLRGGMTFGNFPNLPIDAPAGTETIASGAWGNYGAVSFEIGVASWFAFQAEVTHLQKAGQMGLLGSGNVNLQVEMDYLEAPILAKFRFGSARFRGYAAFGGSIGYALNGKTRFSAQGVELEEKIRFDNSYEGDNTRDNRIDLGAVLALGIEYKIGIGSIVIDTRAALDLNDYTKPMGGRSAFGTKTNHWEGIALSVGYQIPIGRR
jgi:hypothetical protein